MGQLSAFLRAGEDGRLTYWCQGCEEPHAVRVHPDGGHHPGQAWGYDGNPDRPTFTPSVLITSGHYMPGHDPAKGCWCTYRAAHPDQDDDDFFKCSCCHTFIRGGMVEFLSDCTHALAGQTLPLPPLPDHMRDDRKPPT